jgi:hypothetical protein
MSDVFDQFVEHLASLEPAKQSAALSRARQMALNITPDEAFEPPIRTLAQYLADPIEVPPILVEPSIIVRGGITCTIGRAGKGKTVMNLNRIMKWCCGRPMFDDWLDGDGETLLRPTKPEGLKILVIENEGAGGLFHKQVGIMLNAEGYLTDDDRRLVEQNMLIWGDGGYSNLKLDDPVRIQQVKDGCEKWEPDIVFVEPFRGLWTGEENSATDMAVVVDALSDIAADHSCGIQLSHHERKSGAGEDGEKMSAGRGSTVLEGAVSVMENFESAKGGEFRELSWSKSRHAKVPNPVRMEWDADAWWYKHVPTAAIDEAIMSALADNAGEPMTVVDLAEATDEGKDNLRKHANALVKENRLRKLPSISDGRGSTGARYMLASGDNDGGGLAL